MIDAAAGQTIRYDPGVSPRQVDHTIDLSIEKNQMIDDKSGQAKNPSTIHSIPSPRNE